MWKRTQASRLIESFLLDIPLPVVYLAKDTSGNYEVIDGLQRLTSVFQFFNGDFRLTKLQILEDLNGKSFPELSREFQQKLEDSLLRSFELDPRTPKDLMFIIFERLNTGGTKLNEMEIRNCLYRGRLNELVKELAEDDDFRAVVGVSTLGDRMSDRGYVLRFLAFYERTFERCRSGLKSFLNEFMDTYRNPSTEKLEEYRRVFKRTMAACRTIFGAHGFRKLDVRGGWASRPSVAIFQAITVPMARHYDRMQLTAAADSIMEEYIDLISTDDKWLDSVSTSTGEYNNLAYAQIEWARRLKLAVGEGERVDSVRCFSRSLKKEMFAANAICQLCGSEIRTIDDAAIDHVEHYWRGGKTIPENARLVHRACNLHRPN